MAPRSSPTPTPGSQTPLIQLVLTVLLVAAALMVGSLWTKLQTMKEKQAGTGTAVGAPPAADRSVQATLTVDKLPDIAASAGSNKKQFQACLESGRMAQTVKDDEQSGAKAGVSGTPGSILLDTKTGATRFIPGAESYEKVTSAIDSLLAEIDGTPPPTKEPPIPVAPVGDGDHVRGDRNARVALIEYSDLQCPFCKQFHPTVKRALQAYDGKIFWVYRHFPLDNLHPAARKAAEGAECAAEITGPEGFWNYIDKIFEG